MIHSIAIIVDGIKKTKIKIRQDYLWIIGSKSANNT